MTALASTILVVDDDEDVLLIASTYLRDQGYTILEATNGVQGLTILRDTKDIDLLFTDIAMPGGMDGFDLAHRAKQLRPDLRVLYTSGYVKDLPQAEKGMSYGKLLPKPWRLNSLDEAVKRALA
jgi:CheY-like chemotaxis protein